MFGFFKDKLKQAIEKFSKRVDEESETVEVGVKPEKESIGIKAKKPEPATESLPQAKSVQELIDEAEEDTEDEKEEDTEQAKEEHITERPVKEKPKSAEEPAEEGEAAEEEPVKKILKKLTKEEKPAEEEEGAGWGGEAAPVEEEEAAEKEIKEDKTPKEEEIFRRKKTAEETEEVKTTKKEKPAEEEGVAEREGAGLGRTISEEGEAAEEEDKKPGKKGFFARITEAVTETVTKSTLSEEKFADIFWDLEIVLMENNVAVEVIEKIREDLKKRLVDTKVTRGSIPEIIRESLMDSISTVLDIKSIDIISEARKKKPYIIAFVGINGSGKTTTIAKMAYMFKKHGLTPVIAAADTFRAAAIQQIEEHAEKLGVKLIKHDYGSDPAAVAFDAINYAKARGADIVMIDTAGRLHSNTNLMQEMSKIVRVAKPDLKLFIGESITGNDCVEQARQFNDTIEIDGIILSKADVDEKGGAAVSVSYITKKPILYIGTGQEYGDLKEFEKGVVTKSLGLE